MGLNYFVIDMPVNSNGDGPEMDKEKITKIYWQIWDENFQFISAYETKEEADYQCSIMNEVQ